MSHVSLNRDDVQSLGDKIGALEPQLSEKEKALLLGVVAVASDAMSSGSSVMVSRETDQEAPITVEVEGELPPLRDQFVEAFAPGALGDAGGAAKPEVSGTLGITIKG